MESENGGAIEVYCHLLVPGQFHTTINPRMAVNSVEPEVSNIRLYWEQALYLVTARRHVSDRRLGVIGR